MLQPFSVPRERYCVLPRPVEVVIEAYLGAALRAHNCLWIALSVPGTGFCGQLSSKVLAEYIGWVRASYDDSAFPAAVSSGLAQPVLPRLLCAQGISRFKAVAGREPSWEPSLRPSKPDARHPLRWNGCTIQHYASAHNMLPVIEKLTRCRDSFLTFMKQEVRLPSHMFVTIFVLTFVRTIDTDTAFSSLNWQVPSGDMSPTDQLMWLRILTTVQLATLPQSSWQTILLSLSSLLGLQERDHSFRSFLPTIVSWLSDLVREVFNSMLQCLQDSPPLRKAHPSPTGKQNDIRFFVEYAAHTACLNLVVSHVSQYIRFFSLSTGRASRVGQAPPSSSCLVWCGSAQSCCSMPYLSRRGSQMEITMQARAALTSRCCTSWAWTPPPFFLLITQRRP